MPRPDPDTPAPLGQAPRIHRTASVRACSFGRYCHVGARTRLAESALGDYAYVRNDADVIHADIGKFCSIAAHVRLNPGGHRLDGAAMHPFTYRSSAYGLGPDDAAFFEARGTRRVVLGHDVWIGHGAIVLPGVGVGTGAAIGAGAVVTRDVPPFAVAAGNPARVLRMRFPETVVQALLRLAWWDWPHERLHAAMADFRTLGAEGFCARYNGVKPTGRPAP